MQNCSTEALQGNIDSAVLPGVEQHAEGNSPGADAPLRSASPVTSALTLNEPYTFAGHALHAAIAVRVLCTDAGCSSSERVDGKCAVWCHLLQGCVAITVGAVMAEVQPSGRKTAAFWIAVAHIIVTVAVQCCLLMSSVVAIRTVALVVLGASAHATAVVISGANLGFLLVPLQVALYAPPVLLTAAHVADSMRRNRESRSAHR